MQRPPLLAIIGCNLTKLFYCGVYQLLIKCFAHPEPVEGETIHASTSSARTVIFGMADLNTLNQPGMP